MQQIGIKLVANTSLANFGEDIVHRSAAVRIGKNKVKGGIRRLLHSIPPFSGLFPNIRRDAVIEPITGKLFTL